MLERAADTAKSGAKVVAGKVGAGWNAVKGAIGRAAQRAGTDPPGGPDCQSRKRVQPGRAAPIHKNPTKNNVRLFDGHGHELRPRLRAISPTPPGLDTRASTAESMAANASKLTADQGRKLRSDVELQAAMLAELTRENAERGRALGARTMRRTSMPCTTWEKATERSSSSRCRPTRECRRDALMRGDDREGPEARGKRDREQPLVTVTGQSRRRRLLCHGKEDVGRRALRGRGDGGDGAITGKRQHAHSGGRRHAFRSFHT